DSARPVGSAPRSKPPNKVQVGVRRAPRQRFVRAVSADPTCVVATAWLPNKHSAQKSRCIEAAKPRQFSAAHHQMPDSHIATAFTPHHFGRAIWRGDFTMRRLLFVGLALVVAIGLQAQPARAQSNPWNDFWTWINHGQDPRLTWVGIGVGGAATAAGYVMTK